MMRYREILPYPRNVDGSSDLEWVLVNNRGPVNESRNEVSDREHHFCKPIDFEGHFSSPKVINIAWIFTNEAKTSVQVRYCCTLSEPWRCCVKSCEMSFLGWGGPLRNKTRLDRLGGFSESCSRTNWGATFDIWQEKSTSCYTRHLSSSGEDLKSSRNLRHEMRREDVGRSTPDLEDNLQNIDLEGSFVTVVYCHIYIIVS
jgi:hypothetical protein